MARYWLSLLCLFSVGCNLHEPIGVELLYAIDTERSPVKIDIKKVLNAVKRRVHNRGTAEVVDDQIRVGVFGSDQRSVDQVKDMIDRATVSEFRILADRRFDGRLIDIATRPEAAKDRNVWRKPGDSSAAACWCSVAETEAKRLASDRHLVTRRAEAGRTEALVLIDSYHVTGDDFDYARPASDQEGRPSVSFGLSADGARRMRRLTLENMPSGGDSKKQRVLGIVLEGEILSAAAIRSPIEHRGQITGSFSNEQVEDLSALLSVGSLPVHLKLVRETAGRGAESPSSHEI
ncbi:MAG TPA: hypothetical protein VG826_29010 [Pirellulales bacterium]|nr:hypothetical protein [Pirellulales bacterium]